MNTKYTIYRDGEFIADVNGEFELLRWFREHHSFSLQHAVQWEGYSIYQDDQPLSASLL